MSESGSETMGERGVAVVGEHGAVTTNEHNNDGGWVQQRERDGNK